MRTYDDQGYGEASRLFRGVFNALWMTSAVYALIYWLLLMGE